MNGVKESKLLSDLYEGHDHNVPVGKNILTNTASQVDKKLLPHSSGSPLTSLHMDQFDVFGDDRELKEAKRNADQDDVEFRTREVLNDGLIVEAAFEDQDGVLNLVRRNGEVLQIKGFLIQSDFGRGPTGPQGERGYDGYDGEDGEDGPDGAVGCEGPPGPLGLQGSPGEPGEDGVRGNQGPMGQEGAVGLQGPQGEKGRFGHEGARGRPGPDCIGGEDGPQGEQGTTPEFNVVLSDSNPGGNTVIWGKPEYI